jgi:DNA-binding response OmpR family regulator
MSQTCIMIVEPELPIRHSIAEYLRTCGFQVLEAVSTAEAMTLLASDELNVDIIILDASRPGTIDVFSLSQWIKTNNLKTKVLIVGSVQKMTESAARLCEDGPSAKKPYHHQQLHEEIKQLLAAHKRSNDEE